MGVRKTARRFRHGLRAAGGLARKALSIVRAGIHGNRVDAYWWAAETNFGDLLTPALLESYGFTPVRQSPGLARVVCAGSILQQLPEDYSGLVLGAGFARDTDSRSFPRATILGVRGRLSAERAGAGAGVVLGDPGLLIDRLLEAERPRRFALGLVPHYADRRDPRIRAIAARYPGDVCVIDVRRRPAAVARDIAGCGAVISSSLHGIVAADSLGVPNSWAILSEGVVGKGFKFFDYHSAFGERIAPASISGEEPLGELVGRARRISGNAMAEARGRLDELFASLGQRLR